MQNRCSLSELYTGKQYIPFGYVLWIVYSLKEWMCSILRMFRVGCDSSDQVITEYSMNYYIWKVSQNVLKSHLELVSLIHFTPCVLHSCGTVCPARLVKWHFMSYLWRGKLDCMSGTWAPYIPFTRMVTWPKSESSAESPGESSDESLHIWIELSHHESESLIWVTSLSHYLLYSNPNNRANIYLNWYSNPRTKHDYWRIIETFPNSWGQAFLGTWSNSIHGPLVQIPDKC